ncbi:MAG: LysM peptidoglycan-binding domain-containing protein [Wenzhouxiangellaceae bacterium]|nr:MAG: LysM peptidoglycan-binding domain-containing protein [Wenzhouxiangellaceae bacterium]
MPLTTRFQSPLHRLLASILLVLTIAACATFDSQPAPSLESEPPPLPPFFLRAELDDPFQTIDDAVRRVGSLRRVKELEDDDGGDLWQRLVDRFSFAYCPDGSQADQWARWFGDRPDYMERVLNRAQPWLYDIASQIEARDLPGELALLPIVESAYDPFAYSHGRASGAWQFLSGTARDFGIEINEFYDGRRDVYAATRAALDYLLYLGNRFDQDWELALAAYNAGQGRVHRAVQRNLARGRPATFSDISLPRETRAYVPKMHGLGCLFREPDRFGFELPQWPNQPRLARIDLDGPTDIVMLSARSGLDLAELLALNAGLNRHLTSPTGPHHLIVPIDLKDSVLDVLPTLNGADSIVWHEITVRRGDTLSGLAQRHDTSVRALREANGLNGDMLSIGQVLRLPGNGVPPEDSPYADRYQELASLQQRLLPTRRFQHQVRPGESLWLIARQYRVSVADIQRWNGLGGNSLIRPGQRLLIHMDSPGAPTAAPPARSIQYTVRSGDSLWLIARRHQVRLADLMRWNGLNEGSVLRPGQTLTIHRGGSA